MTSSLKLSDTLKEDVGSISGEGVDGALAMLSVLTRLKQTKRTGWINHQIAGPESISDHCFRVAMLGMYVAAEDPTLDSNKVTKMGLIHDCGESVVGDVVPHDPKVTNEQKTANEDKAMRALDAMSGHELLHSLWREFEDGVTPEAKVVKQLDKLEMLLQAVEYERSQGKDLSDFFESCKGKFVHPVIARWAKQIESQRPVCSKTK